ncbi:EscV/YscV/HrcV family type III secretion system export apparatus protein [Noviherbaspirillum saxi]|uniref:EscV/YscV/HrcV family type III secretion system export apparatus protein n=2 Tax=Noviherbaspirillum saxi TaxID=2320863 RepID=A0A3A3FLD0_9BURK|nr:EscV/YscV/HrcV family type III secretion system export apparatus protein [Noviherbaspirillum saxi]
MPDHAMTTDTLERFTPQKLKTSAISIGAAVAKVEIFVALAVIGIVFLLILPIPTAMLDMLIAVNLFISGFLVVLSLYVAGITAFATFPTILLLTTLFRLGISVATTRSILLHGESGAIVETFGEFVVGGNLVVGMVVFLIVTAVQFIVLTKGAERVAEVSARFSLDALPAKQLAIEGELRANLIDQAEAKRQRGLLDTESQLLGAMDGAMKFVKGDAIAGLMIVAINLLGGLTIGVMGRGLSMSEAMRHYSVLTIGDGLVAQIPALLISMTAAILITRGTQKGGGKKGNFGGELSAQLFAYPKALGTVSAVMVLFALIPGMPSVMFGALALISGGGAYYASRREKTEETTGEKGDKRKQEAQVVHEFNQMDSLQVALPAKFENDPSMQTLINTVNNVRNKLVTGLGMTLPVVVFKYEGGLADDAMEFRVYEVPMLRAQIALDKVGVIGRFAEKAAAIPGSIIEPGGGMGGVDIVWVPRDAAASDPDVQSVAVEWESQIYGRVEQKLLRYGPRFTGVQAAQKFLSWMEEWMPELAKELQKAVPASKYADVLQRLLRENISVRNMRLIMETLADYGQRERDTAALTEFVRFALREQICHQLASDGELQAYVLEPELEEHLSSNIRQAAGGGFLALSPQATNQIIAAIRDAVTEFQPKGRTPVLVCAQDVRRYLRTMLEPEFPEVTILAVTELTPEVRVNVITTIALPDEENREDDFNDWGDDS